MPPWLQAMLQNNPGNSTPAWMRPPPTGSSGWPFNYPGSGGSQSTTGTSLIPRPGSAMAPSGVTGLPATQATPWLPATTGGQAPPAVTGGAGVPATTGSGGSLTDLLSGAGSAGSLAGGARGGLAGILATLLGKTAQPQPTNSNEVPFYTMQNGRMQPNPAAASTGQLPSQANTPQPQSMLQPTSGVAKAPGAVTSGATAGAGAPLSLAPPNPNSFLQPPAPQGPVPPSNGLDSTMLGLNASQNANQAGFAPPAAAATQSPMAKLMAMLQQNGNAASMTGGSNSF